jgi:opacity protein-like surface antigen
MTTVVSLCLSTPSTAQDQPFKFEITPFAGYRIGGSFDEKDGDGRVDLNDSNAQGIILNIKANPNGQYELLYARQSTDAITEGFLVGDPTIDLDVEYFHFGGTYLFDGDNTRPFLALTLGLSQFDPGIIDSNSESFFSASLGGGVQLNVTGRLGVRLEARVFTTFVDNNSNIFCASTGGGGGCLIQVDAKIFTQWEARAGLIFRF